MDEDSLYSLRRPPPEPFARGLRASLQRQSASAAIRSQQLRKLMVLGVSCVLVAAAFAVPSVRAAAQAFLDMFRVVHFAAVPVSSDALQRLHSNELDLQHLLSDQVQVSQDSHTAMAYASPGDAGAAAGLHVLLPAWMPVGWDTQAPTVEVLPAKTARVTANAARLQRTLAALDIHDVAVPSGLDGQSATIHISPAVVVRWQHETQTLQLLQAASPQVDFPAGADLAALGEIGLRILGLSRGDAYRFAQSIDWRTTLLVPVPANVASFREVTVRGGAGLLLELADMGGHRHRAGAVLLWSDGAEVFALRGTLAAAELLEMAQSMQ